MNPTRQECLILFERYGMLSHIAAHSLTVSRVAVFLSRELNRKGQRIDEPLVEAASLLHDIAKTECLKTGEDHAEVGARLLRGLGYDQVAAVVAQHVELWSHVDRGCTIRDEEVVNYADKRVRHDRIVSLEERFLDLKERYGKTQRALDRLDHLETSTAALERKIFSVLEREPKDLERLGQENLQTPD
jgi:uncharacterized protein